ncbi:TKL/TKL-ccin protein kinase [Mycena alexandri]|uniref:TKL/TKL-ccin protein kinase n=1 Tax=Mycena alexandri TaxID=1745969 RepID=A0AAD6SPC8_9AGAR|nr:TKL/TKL-ccin protein kinase [Mycena alexandri]
MSFLQAPKAPPDTLRREAWRILARLDLIIEFRPWLDHIKHTKHTVVANSPFVLLWETFALGASLATLLNLLGSAPPRDLTIDAAASAEKDLKTEFGLGLPHREKYFTNFIQRVQLLELQQKIPFGEVLRVQDLFGGTNSGFAKVLKAVSRVLTAIQDSFPGLFVLPPHAAQEREEYMHELVDSERAHVAALRMTGDSAELLSEEMARPLNPCLECLIISRPLLRQYHDRVLALLEGAALTPLKENWDQIFAFEHETRKNAIGAYRSICANYLGLADVLQRYLDGSQPLLASHAQILLTNVSVLLSRTAAYSSLVDKILSLTSPADSPTYDALCTASFRLAETSTNLNEMGLLVRTLRASRILQQRAFSWQKGVDPAELGPLLLGDVLGVAVSNSAHSTDSNLGMHGTQGMQQYAVFLFEMMLLCCAEVVVPVYVEDSEEGDGNEYPVQAWELGPALQRTTPLNLVHAIPTHRLKLLRVTDSDSFELDWTDDSNNTRTLEFYTTCAEQYDQWCGALEAFVPAVFVQHAPSPGASDLGADADEQHAGILSEDEDAGGRRRSHARSWSLVGRKGPRSESSSLLRQEGGWASDQESLLSPNLLPRFFGGSQDVSPLAINTTFPRPHLGTAVNEALGGFEVPPTPPPDSEPYVEADPATLLDLTGQVRREGSYPQAHGGFADVWKGVWDRQPDRWVAVKVLRSRLDDPQREAKMNKRLAHEVSVWKRLDHKHVLKLLGTVSDFGPYDSMVCPWLEQGSVSKYMERRGDILSMTDRLQLLCEVADGLNYLHENSIVHGDLTGSNILIDDDHRARLCDFGLSSIVVEFCGTTSLTSCIGGAVRWADAALYSLPSSEDGLDEGGDSDGATQPEETKPEQPVITTRNDIYSFGSVTLEILSGRIPYHYLRQDAQVVIELHKGNKPRRPAVSFVTDAQWSFIQHCWASDLLQRPDAAEVIRAVGALHRASLEFRRHTY